MQRSLRILSLAALLLLFAGSAWGLSKTIEETLPLDSGGQLSLENINGNVSITGWDGSEVKLKAEVRARTQEGLDRIRVEIDAASDRIHIESVYENTNGWGRDDGGEVEYTLEVPRNTRLDEIELVNGNLALQGVSGDVRIELVNGKAEVSGLAGNAELSTVNGNLVVAFDELGGAQEISLESVNGSIELSIPSYADASIEASTVHGRISNDLGLEVEKGRWVGSSLEGDVGRGGARVSLENVNGKISIRGTE
jgi:hypothetical protein